MNLKNCLSPRSLCTKTSASLLVLRIVVGLAFVFHGWGKIQNPFAWMGPEAPVPGILQFLAALAEFGGGIAWIIGLLTPIASLGMLVTMLVATYFHAVIQGDPFVGQGGPSYELAIVYLCISIHFLVIGPGEFSVDKLIFGEKK